MNRNTFLAIEILAGLMILILIIVILCSNADAATIIVDDDGGADFTSIQEALDASKNGDTVFVNSGIYHENLVVTTSINLTGENRDETTIDGNDTDYTIYIKADWVNITGFRIRGGGAVGSREAGMILSRTKNCSIHNNNFSSNKANGLILYYADNTSITENVFSFNQQDGIQLWCSSNNSIVTNNIYSNNISAILIYDSHWNDISGNIIFNNTGDGIVLIDSNWNYMINNSVYKNQWGIQLHESSNNTMNSNDIIVNYWAGIDIYIGEKNTITNNTLSGNYGGIELSKVSENIIRYNRISSHWGRTYHGEPYDDHFGGVAISLEDSDRNHIVENTISENYDGISLFGSHDNHIFENNVSFGNRTGLLLWESNENNISGNHISHCYVGLYLGGILGNNSFEENILYNNTIETLEDPDGDFLDTSVKVEYTGTLAIAWLSPMLLLIIIGVNAGIPLLVIIFAEPAKFKFLLFFNPLYTRLNKKEVLDHETRGLIRGAVETDPGIHYNELKKKLKLKNGTLSYHLQVLEREGYIRSRNNGIFKHFFPGDMKPPKKIVRMTDIQKLILKKIMENPGVSIEKITKLIAGESSEITYPAVRYNIHVLAEKGVIDLRKNKRIKECYVIEED